MTIQTTLQSMLHDGKVQGYRYNACVLKYSRFYARSLIPFKPWKASPIVEMRFRRRSRRWGESAWLGSTVFFGARVIHIGLGRWSRRWSKSTRLRRAILLAGVRRRRWWRRLRQQRLVSLVSSSRLNGLNASCLVLVDAAQSTLSTHTFVISDKSYPKMFSVAKLIALAVCAQSASAALFMTSPVASSSWAAGQQQTISWQDDGNQPTLEAFGPASVSLAVGSAQQQTSLQTVIASVDVSTTSSIVFTPDPSVGANGGMYFIRIQSLSLKDATQTQYPALAFSAKFTMTGMTGTFNATVQQQIDGASGAPASGGSAPTTPAPATSPSATTSPSKTGSSTSGSSTPTPGGAAKDSGALGMVASGAAAIAGSVFAAAMLL